MIVKDKGANGGARVLKILNNAGRMPIGATEMKAVYYFIYNFSKNAGLTISDDELSETIVTKDQKDWYIMAKGMREADKAVTLPIGLSIVLGARSAGETEEGGMIDRESPTTTELSQELAEALDMLLSVATKSL
jgi:hypothetical protein